MKLKAGQFYGKTSQTLRANEFRFTEKSYSTDARLPSHAHELSHFCLVLAGNYREKIGSREFERSPLALVFYPPDVSHAEEHRSNGRHLLVEIDFAGLEKVRQYGARLGEPVLLGGESSDWLAARMYREFSRRDRFSPLALESISTELLIAASRQSERRAEKNAPRWLGRVKEYLNENFASPPGLGDLAEAAGVHPTHLARVFRQFEHCTAGEYVRRVRLEKARRKMISSRASLVEIALETGFSDQAHFTRTFKRETGMTPTEFRKIFADFRF
ncbi:MAG: AraC family transcriptional regulator [Pyrinomonadaceae bacterium]